MSSNHKKRVNLWIIRIISKIRRYRHYQIHYKSNLLWYFSREDIFVYVYRLEVSLRLSYQIENDLEKEIDDKHFIFKTVL